MSEISQNQDGTYQKQYSATELYIIKSLAEEVKARVQADQLLWIDVTGISNRLRVIEDKDTNLENIQLELTKAIGQIQTNSAEITRLDKLLGVDAYSKKEMDRYVISWKVEQIPHRFATPTNDMFDKIDIDDLQSGYVSYLNADINEPHDNHIPENTMRRFTISAYVETPREVTFHIHYADRLNVYLNGVSEAVYTDTEGNFGSVRKVLPLMLKEGWNKFQFLLSNETQRGGLVIESDLYEKSDYLSNLDDLSGMITGDRIQAGTLDETHFSPNMDLVVNTLTATADNVPGVMIGDPNGCGILQIGDKTITKCINEPFVFDDGIRVNGYIYVSQLLIDVDFILQGDGILIDKIKDAATGFTRAYTIHNDLRVLNGGGLTIVGDGRKGYTFTNAMKLIGDQKLGGMVVNPEPNESGLDISGDAVKGYYIRNAMLMTVEGTGGLLITGNPQTGYFIKNTMNLSAYKGLKVEGDPSTAGGYVLKNQMGMTGNGVTVTPTPFNTDYVYNWHIENATSITPTCLQGTSGATTGGGLSVVKEGAGVFKIGNAMKLTANANGPVSVTGDACSGYAIDAKWPVIQSGAGISVMNPSPGNYTIRNDGVINVMQGDGIRVTARDAQGTVYVSNAGVLSVEGGTGINVSGAGNGRYQISTPAVTSVVSQGDIQASVSNNTLYLSYTAPEPPPPIIIQPPDPGPTDPPPTGGGSVAGTGQLTLHTASGIYTMAPTSGDDRGVAGGTFRWNDSTVLTISVTVGGNPGKSGNILAALKDNASSGDNVIVNLSGRSIPASATHTSPTTATWQIDRAATGNRDEFYVGISVSQAYTNTTTAKVTISARGTFSGH